MPKSPKPTRKRIISAATKLFYNAGIQNVSVDAIAAKAGVTKRTLYYHFKSKDDLITAYLESHDQPTRELYARWFREVDGPIDKKIEGMFRGLAEAASHPRWRGCGFLRTSAELANAPGHPAVKAGAAHKKKFEAWLVEVLKSEDVQDPELVARKLVVLLDGAATIMLIHHDPSYAEAAGTVAMALVAGNI